MKRWAGIAAAIVVAGGMALADDGSVSRGARAEIRNRTGEKVGHATLTETGRGTKISVVVFGLPPGRHGIHIHGCALCDPPDFTTAGWHFNPFRKKHGLKNPEGAHLGDLPNLEVGPDGAGRLEATVPNLELVAYAPTAVIKTIGTALVIHAGPDDETTDPFGNSGERIACGVLLPVPAP